MMFAVKSSPTAEMGSDDSITSFSSSSSSSSESLGGRHEDGDRTLDMGESSDSSSDEDEGGIFFGTHTDAESLYLAKLSATSPARPPISPPHRRRQSKLVSMIRRDSTEFNRRKTMAFPIPKQEEEEGKERSSDERIQERYQQEVSHLQMSPSAFTSEMQTPSSASRNPLLNAFASMHIAPSPHLKQSDEVSVSESNDSEISSESGHSDSDKENVEVRPESENGEQVEDDFLDSLGLDVTRGMRDSALDFGTVDDIALDLGGMKLSDFADPDEEVEANPVERSVSYDSSDDGVDGPLDSPTVRLAPLPRSGSREKTLISPPRQTSSPGPSSPIARLEQTESLTPPFGILPDDENPLMDDIPVNRAAVHMVETVLFSPLRTSDSPLRSLPSAELAHSPYKSPFATNSENANLATADPTSPTPASALSAGTPAVARTPRQLGPLPTTVTPSRVRGDLVPLAERSSKVLKPRPVGPSVTESAPLLKEKSRTLAVRGRLESMFNKKVNTMGPPQRVLSASSSAAPSSNENSRPPSRAGVHMPSKVQVKPPTSKIVTGMPRPGSSLSRSVPAPAKSANSGSMFGRSMPAKASSSCRPPPPSALATVSAGSTRSALAPRSLITHPAKQAHSKNMEVKVQRPAMPPPVSLSRSIAVAGPSMQATQVNPLKRPLSQSLSMPSSMARQTITIGPSGSRPALGLPSRLVRDPSNPRAAPMFHIGVGPVDMSLSRSTLRSPLRQPAQRLPGTPMGQKTARLGTPSRAEGTPRTIRAKPSFQILSQSVDRPSQDVSAVSPSGSSGPPAQATRHASESHDMPPASSESGHRGSSEDAADVSIMLPQPPSSSPPAVERPSPESPISNKRSSKSQDKSRAVDDDMEAGRPKRAVKPRILAPPVAPYISGKELKTTTDRNTMRNQVYFCAIDRQIVHVPGPRPPSPTSKIRTTADRDEDNKKKSRENRAKRRSARESGASTDAGSPERPIIQRIEQIRGPGDDEDWKTPARPAKKAKLREEKNVKWDRGLVIIHDDGSQVKPSASLDEPPKGCVRNSSMIDLDKNGNINESARPKIDLKRSKIVVTAVFYEGEEPVPVEEAPPPASSSSGGKKKK